MTSWAHYDVATPITLSKLDISSEKIKHKSEICLKTCMREARLSFLQNNGINCYVDNIFQY